ncbi:hypothetical protein KC19_5G188100 [Ceratodon purpureus]|uniref:Uncharacterized protein n=1 Tax=Ceratodon purpureus TaxID=3225 RepID=A0A8T0I452_CERPU|nr:hypothetical protein KC19_5G188100 [Ceratodon purpureus]
MYDLETGCWSRLPPCPQFNFGVNVVEFPVELCFEFPVELRLTSEDFLRR